MEQPDSLGHTGSGGGGGSLESEVKLLRWKFQDDVAHITRGCCDHDSQSRYAAGCPGRGGPKGPGGDRWRSLGLSGEG